LTLLRQRRGRVEGPEIARALISAPGPEAGLFLTNFPAPVRLALSDVAFAMVGNLGRIAEATLGGRDQPKDGNYLDGAFGHDFETRDGRRLMVVALTARQWAALKAATGIEAACRGIEDATGQPRRRERSVRGTGVHRRRPAALVRLPRRSLRAPPGASANTPTRFSASCWGWRGESWRASTIEASSRALPAIEAVSTGPVAIAAVFDKSARNAGWTSRAPTRGGRLYDDRDDHRRPEPGRLWDG
jgi:hypothetical protein